MNEDEIITQLINTLDADFPAGVRVKTEGGDTEIDPPEIVVSWSSTREPTHAGHTPYVGPLTDDSGTAIGLEYHMYQLFDADVLLRYEDEVTADQAIDTIHERFLMYEDRPSDFHQDTMQWVVGSASPRDNSFVEPDWYERGVSLSFVYLKALEIEDSGLVPDVIESIDTEVNSRDLVVADGDTYEIESDSTRFFRSIDVSGTLDVYGTVYTTSATESGSGTITVHSTGELNEVDSPYDEIDETTSQTIVN